MRLNSLLCLCLVLLMGAAACKKAQPPVARPTPPAPPPSSGTATRPPDPPAPMREPMPPPPLASDDVSARSLDDLNRDSPLQPVFFDLDSSDVNDSGRGILQANAGVLKKYPTWSITIEGHCDERGTAEYNLALGERRAVAARTYLVITAK
jgi:peptidoglycan-associated lipoprotein